MDIAILKLRGEKELDGNVLGYTVVLLKLQNKVREGYSVDENKLEKLTEWYKNERR